MTKVEQEPRGQEPPTHLQMFRYSPEYQQHSREAVREMKFFIGMGNRNRDHWDRQGVKGSAIIEHLEGVVIDAEASLHMVDSSITAAKSYISISEETKTKFNWTDDQAFDFYKQCLKHNFILQSYSEGRESRGMSNVRRMSVDYYNQRVVPTAYQVAEERPDWFQSSKQEYAELIAEYGNLWHFVDPSFRYLAGKDRMRMNNESREALAGRGDLRGKHAYLYGSINKESLPDWLVDAGDAAPDMAAVQGELTEDEEQEQELISRVVGMNGQINFIDTSYHAGLEKARDWQQKQYEALIENNKIYNFGDSFLYLEHFPEHSNHYVDIYADPHATVEFDRGAMTLWMEKNLETAGIVERGIFTPQGREVLGGFLATVGQNPEESEVAGFRQTYEPLNKKGFRALHYDVRPFLQFLTAEQRSELVEMVEEYDDPDADPIITFIGESASQTLEEHEGEDYDQLRLKAVRELGQFIRKFVRNNWQWGAAEYRKVLFPSEKPAPQSQEVQEVVEEKPDFFEDMDKEVAEVEKSPLQGWNVMYAVDRRKDKAVAIPAQTVDELAQAIKDIKRDEGISSSVKDGSIARALEWKVTTPQEVEYFAYKKQIGEETWKKIKRGAVRILYQIDPDTKTLTFFLHQKKKWEYGF